MKIARVDKSFQRIGYVGDGPKPQSKVPDIVEEKHDRQIQEWVRQGQLVAGTKVYRMGQCLIIVSPPLNDEWGWHLSISHPTRYPTWDEVAKARYALLPLDKEYEMPLPSPDEYISIHPNCFQVHENGKRRAFDE
jgi:hypothetical protein